MTVGEPEINLDTGRADGEAQEVLTEFVGNIQPITGAELERLKNGRQVGSLFQLWTLKSLDMGDIVFHKGKRHEVEGIEDWDNLSSTLRHYVYVLRREARGC